jgi:hypothetical protein
MEPKERELRAEKVVSTGLEPIKVTDEAVNRAIKSVSFALRCSSLAQASRSSLLRFNSSAGAALIAGLIIGIGVFGIALLFTPRQIPKIAESVIHIGNQAEQKMVSSTIAPLPIDRSGRIMEEIQLFGKTIASYSDSGCTEGTAKNSDSITLNMFAEEFQRFSGRVMTILRDNGPTQ